jgi:hypothetical protein
MKAFVPIDQFPSVVFGLTPINLSELKLLFSITVLLFRAMKSIFEKVLYFHEERWVSESGTSQSCPIPHHPEHSQQPAGQSSNYSPTSRAPTLSAYQCTFSGMTVDTSADEQC